MATIREQLVVLAGIILTASVSMAGEFEIHPSIAVSEEYTDNVFDSGTNRVDEFITRLMPAVTMGYKSSAVTADLTYMYDYRYFANNSHSSDTAHVLDFRGLLTPVENLFYIDLSDVYQQVSLDVTRPDVTKESLYADQAEQNVAIVSPYFRLNLGERGTLKTGYRYVDTRYFDDNGVDKIDHVGFLDASYRTSERFWLTTGYIFTHEEADPNNANSDNYDQHLAYGGFRYEYGANSFIFGQGGYAWTEFDSGHEFDSRFWSGGASHTFDTVTASMTTGVKYEEDPRRNIIQNNFVRVSLDNSLQRGAVGVFASYNEYVLTETDTVQTRKTSGGVHGRHEFTPDLNGRLAVSLENYEQPILDGDTRRLLVEAGINYQLGNQFALALSYIYSSYDSDDFAADNKYVNRGIIELKKTF